MSEMYYLILAVIAILSAPISMYIAAKLLLRTVKNGLFDMLDEYLDAKISDAKDYLNGEKGQKMIYSLGVLIGSGAKQGVGLGRPTGKGGFEGLLMQAIPYLFGNLGQGANIAQNAVTQQATNQQSLNANRTNQM